MPDNKISYTAKRAVIRPLSTGINGAAGQAVSLKVSGALANFNRVLGISWAWGVDD